MLTGCALLMVAYNTGEVLCRNPLLKRFTLFVSGLSYYSFLIHHRIIFRVLQGFDKVNTMKAAIILLGVIVLTFGFSYILKIIMDHVYTCKLFEKAEQVLFAKTANQKKANLSNENELHNGQNSGRKLTK